MSGVGSDRTDELAGSRRLDPVSNALMLWATRLELVAVAILVLGVLIGAVVVLRTEWVPVEDLAWMEMRVRDVPGHLPLNGVYSRFGGSHPGPAQFYLLWPLYQISGGVSASLLVSTLILHVGATLLAWAVARSLDLVAGVTVLLAAEVVILTTPIAELRSPWNPFVVLVLGMALVVLGWGAAERRPFATALLLPVSTILVQSHAGTVGLVAAALVAAAAGAAVGWAGDGSSRREVPWRALVGGAALSTLAWVPPLVAQLRGDEGRWTELIGGSSDGGQVVGAGRAFGLLTRSLGPWPSWADPTSMTEPFASTSMVAPAFAVVLIGAWWVALRRRDRCMLRGLVVATCCLVGAATAAAMLRGSAYGYLVAPVRTAGAATVALSIATLLGPLSASRTAMARVLLSSIAVVLAAVAGGRQLSTDVPWEPLGASVGRLGDAVLYEPMPEGGYVVVPAPDWEVGHEGVMLQLDRAGVDVVIRSPQFTTQVGPRRREDGVGDGRTELTVAPADDAVRLRDEGWRIVAVDRPLSDADRKRVADLRARLMSLDTVPPADTRDAALERLDLVDRLREVLVGRSELLVAVRDR